MGASIPALSVDGEGSGVADLLGLSVVETARQLGMKQKEVQQRLDELASELLEVSETTGD